MEQENGNVPVKGKHIRMLRILRGMENAEDLAERVGISKTYMYQIESGNQIPSVSVLQKIAQVLGVPLPSLFADGVTDNITDYSTEIATTVETSETLNILSFIKSAVESNQKALSLFNAYHLTYGTRNLKLQFDNTGVRMVDNELIAPILMLVALYDAERAKDTEDEEFVSYGK